LGEEIRPVQPAVPRWRRHIGSGASGATARGSRQITGCGGVGLGGIGPGGTGGTGSGNGLGSGPGPGKGSGTGLGGVAVVMTGSFRAQRVSAAAVPARKVRSRECIAPISPAVRQPSRASRPELRRANPVSLQAERSPWRIVMHRTVLAVTAAILCCSPALAQETPMPAPPQNALKLSEILAKVEQRDGFRYIDELEWNEEGYWDVTYFTTDKAKVEMKFNPVTGEPQ
jgi:hypothetical protein